MSSNRRIILSDGSTFPPEPLTEPLTEPPFDEDLVTEIDYSDVDAREDDIEQLSADYILCLMGLQDCADIEDVGITRNILSEIIDSFELVLAELGFFIYRPYVQIQPDGKETILPSRYADYGEPST